MSAVQMGPPQCQHPDCEEDAIAETEWTYCRDHNHLPH